MMIDIINVDNTTLFWYIAITMLTVYAFSRIDIKLNVVYGTFLVVVILYFLNNEYSRSKNTINDMLELKKNIILPKTKNLSKYNEIINLLFSVQDFYVYNAQAYEDMVESLDMFFLHYEEVIYNNDFAGKHYDILNDKKRFALNSLHSIIYDFPANLNYKKKLNKAIGTLNDILSYYLNNVKLINDNNIYKYGYNTDTHLITNSNIVPYNTFDNQTVFDIY